MTDKKIQIEGAAAAGGGGEGGQQQRTSYASIFKERGTFWVMVHGIGHAKKKS
jgi:hypothetical protein